MQYRVRGFVLVALVGVACAVAPAVAQAPRPAIAIANRALVFGQHTLLVAQLLNGAGDAGRQVQLLERPVTQPRYRIAGSGTADPQGRAFFDLNPGGDAFYAVRTIGGTPQVTLGLRVRVRPSIAVRISDRTPRRGARVRFAGIVKPDIDGTIVRIQRRRFGSTYTTVRVTRLRNTGAANSFYTARIRIRRSGSYRVVTNPTATLNVGASGVRHIRVHR